MSNIYKIIDEEHLLEILNKYQMKLTTVSFTTKQDDADRAMKNCLIKLAKEYVNHMFIYIDLDNYKTKNVVKDISVGDTIIFFCYPRYECAAKIVKRDVDAVVDIFKDTEARIRMKMMQLQQQQNKPPAKQAPIAPQQVVQQPVRTIPTQKQQPMMPQPVYQTPVAPIPLQPLMPQQNPIQQPVYHAPVLQQPIIPPQNVSAPKQDLSNLLNQIDVARKKKETKK